ncbi:Multidrug resistance-associated protein 4 [Stylophora pistillata]|uniref:Multidrug resistance-associated protein 4 n=1 Tax=Stylophora pistillata TaxID=50429 RepID=A0A2B4SPH1_STYPI|nr:Multidrug resistance-associated protein 4 [Stylophora pistillata]
MEYEKLGAEFEEGPTICSRLTFGFLSSVIETGNKRPLEGKDIPSLDVESTKSLTEKLELEWIKEIQIGRVQSSEPRLRNALLRAVDKYLMAHIVLLANLETFCTMIQPVLLRFLLTEMSSNSPVNVEMLLVYSTLLCVSCFIQTIVTHQGGYAMFLMEAHVKASLTGIIYKKILNTRHRILAERTSGLELNIVYKKGVILAGYLSAYSCYPIVSSFVSFSPFLMAENHLTAQNVFTTLALLGALQKPVTVLFSYEFRALFQAFKTLERVESFLLDDDCDEALSSTQKRSPFQSKDYSGSFDASHTSKTQMNEYLFSAVEPTFLTNHVCDKGKPFLCLNAVKLRPWDYSFNLSVCISGCQLIGITGPVACGKLILFDFILGVTPSGQITRQGKFAYVCQTPWVFSGTIRENIIFGKEFNHDNFEKAVDACSLKEDLKSLACGDLTYIGERGVSLSGGQRARLNLARAVYSDADIYLLDGPLSSVDVRVSNEIFQRCICGALSDRIRLMITHEAHSLAKTDLVLLMDKESKLTKATYKELCELEEFSEISATASSFDKANEGGLSCNLMPYGATISKNDDSSCFEIEEEDRLTGSVSYLTYWRYLAYGMSKFFIIIWGALVVLPEDLSHYEVENIKRWADKNLMTLNMKKTFEMVVKVLSLYISKRHVKAAREFKRIEAITSSPVCAHVTDRIQGIATVRVYKREGVFLDRFYSYQDANNRALFCYTASLKWLGIRLDSLSSVLVTVVILSAIFLSGDTALSGLSISYCLQLTNTVQWMLQAIGETENYMTSVERVLSCPELQPEPGYDTTIPRAPIDWPQRGCVTFKDVSLNYFLGGPSILKNISFSVIPGEKIGIVGRTGAGKSSIIACLLRMPANTEGEIIIDGICVAGLNVQDIGTAIAVIPQSPFLFNDVLRRSLDPADKFTDEELWNVLDKVKLKSIVANRDGQLYCHVTENGANFSVGERQLICFARAILFGKKTIVMDEATSSVDTQTDELIHSIIRKEMSHCTVFTIAHRLSTVSDYERIMVLSEGKIVEMDSPEALLRNDLSSS